MSEKTEQLGLVIAEARKAKGLSQKELAIEAGYDASGVSVTRIETGAIRRPSDKKLDRLAAALDLSTDRLRLLADQAAARGLLDGPAARRANKQRATELHQGTETLQRAVDAAYLPLFRVRAEVEESFLTPLLELGQCVRGIQLARDTSQPALEPSDIGRDFLVAADDYIEQVRAHFAWHFAAGTATGAVIGSAIGGAAAYATYSAVGAFASASTGAAISGLYGAARTSATLAAIGRRSLPIGGTDMTSGAIALRGMVAAPALVFAGIGLAVAGGRKLSAEGDTEEQRLRRAENVFEANSRRLYDSFDRAGQAQAFLTLATSHGTSQLQALRAETLLTPETPVDWNELSDRAQETLGDLVELAGITFGVLPLPSVPELAEDLSADEASDIMKAAREWDQAVLQEALALFAKIVTQGLSRAR